MWYVRKSNNRKINENRFESLIRIKFWLESKLIRPITEWGISRRQSILFKKIKSSQIQRCSIKYENWQENLLLLWPKWKDWSDRRTLLGEARKTSSLITKFIENCWCCFESSPYGMASGLRLLFLPFFHLLPGTWSNGLLTQVPHSTCLTSGGCSQPFMQYRVAILWREWDRTTAHFKQHEKETSALNLKWMENGETISFMMFYSSQNFGANLFSVRAATKRGVRVVFDNGGVSITYNSSVVATGTSNRTNLYLLNFELVNHINKKEDTSVVQPHLSPFKNQCSIN